jgi:hypothetical protein
VRVALILGLLLIVLLGQLMSPGSRGARVFWSIAAILCAAALAVRLML